MSDKPHPKVFLCSESPGTGLQIPHSGCFDSEALKKVLPRPGVLPLLIPCTRCVCVLRRFWQACGGGSVRREPERNCADKMYLICSPQPGQLLPEGMTLGAWGWLGQGLRLRPKGLVHNLVQRPAASSHPRPRVTGVLSCVSKSSRSSPRGENNPV